MQAATTILIKTNIVIQFQVALQSCKNFPVKLGPSIETWSNSFILKPAKVDLSYSSTSSAVAWPKNSEHK